jgi:hypothetical protein
VSIITQPHADTIEVDEFIEFIVHLLCRRGAAHPGALRKLSRMAAFYAALTEDRVGARSEKGGSAGPLSLHHVLTASQAAAAY